MCIILAVFFAAFYREYPLFYGAFLMLSLLSFGSFFAIAIYTAPPYYPCDEDEDEIGVLIALDII